MKAALICVCLVGLMLAIPAAFAQTAEPAATSDSTGTTDMDVMESQLSATAVVASGIEEREPIGEAATFPASVSRVYLWTVVKGASDSTFITHTWYFDTTMVQEITLPVKASPWRTWSYKTIDESMVGSWRIEVRGPGGEPLAEKSFTITAAPMSDSAMGN